MSKVMQVNKKQEELSQAQYPETTEIAYPYSVRIEQSAKGARVSVHVYSKSLDVAVKESIETYLKTREQLQEAGLTLAPEE